MQCVKTAGFTVCINGERYGDFKGGMGLRQRDPLSPYLFTLIIEILTLLLQRNIRNNSCFKYHYRCKELQLVNLCFSDDLMIFYNGDLISVGLIKEGLNEFSATSGLFPNLSKSTLFFGSLKDEEKEQIKKNKYLLYVGRLMLIAAVLESISVYWASVFKLPKTVVKEVNSILKRFLWSNGDYAKGKAKIAWKMFADQKSMEVWGSKILKARMKLFCLNFYGTLLQRKTHVEN
ncbi:RNA-directed DNA polymerase, eukaryota, reverse transcriptase zinc-binding domain protein [Tanacetum coccineum]